MRDVSLDFIIQALIIFEGLSLWKLSRFVDNWFPSSTVGITYEEAKKKKWDKVRTADNPTVWQFLKLHMFCLFMCVKTVIDWFVSLLKMTPYLTSLSFVFGVYLYALNWIPASFSSWMNRDRFIYCSAIFIAVKLLVNILSLLINFWAFRSIQQEIPKAGTLSNDFAKAD